MIPFPDKKYNIIYADPAWHLTYVKQWNRNPKIKEKYKIVKLPYPTLTDEEIINLPVKNITADDAILFIWCIDSRIPILKDVMNNWGFTFKTVGFVWNKTAKTTNGVNATIGKYTRKSCEFCFIGTKGKSLAKLHYQNQYYPEPKRKHSQKPDKIRDMIVTMCGDLPRIELFARERTEGWDCWGNEV